MKFHIEDKQTATTIANRKMMRPVEFGGRLRERKRVVSFEMGQLEEEMRRRPPHRRSESLSCSLDAATIIIYDDERTSERGGGGSITPSGNAQLRTDQDCDITRTTRLAGRHERGFYLLKDVSANEEQFLSSSSSRVHESHKAAAAPPTPPMQAQQQAKSTVPIEEELAKASERTKSTQANTNSEERRGRQIDKKLTTKFKLKLLLAKVKSLAASYLLLTSVVTLMLACEHQPIRAAGALVINVGTRAGQPQHHDRARRRSFSPTADDDNHPRHHPHQRDHLDHHNHQPAHHRANQTRTKRATSGEQQQQPPPQRSAKLLELDALNYLQRYGYMNSSSSSLLGSNAINLISEDSFHGAIMQFQRFAGIPETGSVDQLTVRYMQMPRCGNKDMSGKGENGKRKRKRRRRRKRYALQGSKWRRQELTYRISQYPTRFSHKKHEVDGQIERAFRIWSQVAPIDFVVKKEGRVHIDIRFANGEHGDGDPFDGPGNTLAHAYFPQYGGDAHFDDQEYWTVDSYAGTNIFQVAAHELGHSLGLGHSSVREALMAPFYQKYKPNFKLHADDVLAIQALYGERGGADSDESPGSGSSTTSTTSTTESSAPVPPRRRPIGPPPPAPPSTGGGDEDDGGSFFGFGSGSGAKPVDLCQDARIDAVTRTEDGSTYVFRGQHYWQIKNEGLASGSPGKIARDWDGLPGNLDAALTWSDGKTFFFKGDKYWRYFNKRREPGYPKLISVGFAGIPNNLDAAFVWSGNGKTYFFKRDKYWRFDSKQEPPVSGQYPKPLKNWVGLPGGGVDAAFKWENGMTYFFKDDLYYRFDDREFEVDSSARPAFPRSTAEWWFGCTSSNLPIRRRPTSTSASENDDDSSLRSSNISNDNETGESSQTAPSVLLFHRKPNLIYDTTTSGSGRQPGASQGGTSLTRSLIFSLSALFPSSSNDASSSSSSSSLSSLNSPQADNSPDWSFHRGIGEEARRFPKSGRSVPGDASTRWAFPLSPGSSLSGSPDTVNNHELNNNNNHNRHHHHPASYSWATTSDRHNYNQHNQQPNQQLQPGHVSREQSMSELRLAPPAPSLMEPPGQELTVTGGKRPMLSNSNNSTDNGQPPQQAPLATTTTTTPTDKGEEEAPVVVRRRERQ